MKADKEISDEAVAYVKSHQKELIEKFVGDVEQVAKPISIFMAGSPGAGKTEFSTHLIDEILGAHDKIVRIDPDAIRMWLPQYIPGRAELFQEAVTTGVNKLHDYTKTRNISFLLDGTFSNLEKARNNINLSLAKGRKILIQYVIQPPEIAWKFTQDREKVDGRNILREDFIDQFIGARDAVAIMKMEFGSMIQVDLVERNLSTGRYNITFNIDNLDKYLPKKYSRGELYTLV